MENRYKWLENAGKRYQKLMGDQKWHIGKTCVGLETKLFFYKKTTKGEYKKNLQFPMKR